MNLGLAGRVGLVVGSSRGIGLAIAEAFLREGAHVVITGRNSDALEEAQATLASQSTRSRVLAVQGDMIRESDLKRALSQSVEAFGGVDAVVANLGSGTEPSGWDLTTKNWSTSLNINLLGSMLLVRNAMPYLIDREGASFTFISSIAGFESISAPVAYSAGKAAILSAMKSLSRLVGPHGVRVNAVAPGNILFPGGTWERKLKDRKEFFEDYIQREVPLQRFGRPDEIGDAVVFLSSERASFITGACLVVDGGQTRSF